jgi:superfamily II DNA/RNA helicase
MCPSFNISSVYLLPGGANPLRQLMALKEHKPHIVVSTPGRLLKVGMMTCNQHAANFVLYVCHLQQCRKVAGESSSFVGHKDDVHWQFLGCKWKQ